MALGETLEEGKGEGRDGRGRGKRSTSQLPCYIRKIERGQSSTRIGAVVAIQQ